MLGSEEIHIIIQRYYNDYIAIDVNASIMLRVELRMRAGGVLSNLSLAENIISVRVCRGTAQKYT